MDRDDVKILQLALELITGEPLNSNGQFGHYTEKLVKMCQEKLGINPDGVVDNSCWEKLLSNITLTKFLFLDMLEKQDKKNNLKDNPKQNEVLNDISKDREEHKKRLKDKQNKEASASLSKIELDLTDLSDLK
jgi:Putative peptidoglycan-binding domain-containing protein